jgi:hypothetical protein
MGLAALASALKRLVLLVAALLVLIPRFSLGQEWERPGGRFKLGPLYLTPRLLLQSGVETNVYNTEEGPTRDNTTVLSPQTDIAIPIGRRFALTGRGAVNLNYFATEESERSTDFIGTAQAEVRLGRVKVFAGGGGGRFKQRFSTEIDERVQRYMDEVHGGAWLKLTRKLELRAEGREQTTTHDAGVVVDGNDVKTALDRRTRTGRGELRLALSSRTTLIGLGEAQHDLFLQAPTDTRNEAESYRYMGGFEFTPRARIRGQLMAGVRNYPDTPDQAVPPYTGPALGINIQAPVFKNALLSATAGRDVAYSVSDVVVGSNAVRNSYISEAYGLTLAIALPWKLEARGNGGIGRSDYLLPVEVDGVRMDRLDRIRLAGVSLLRGFGRVVKLGGTIQWTRRMSDVPGFSYHSTSYGLAGELVP